MKMQTRICFSILILCALSGFVLGSNFYYPGSDEDDDSEHETLIREDGNGICTYEIRKNELVTVEVSYDHYETYYGRCRGYYFRKCINERLIPKTRMENRIQPKTQEVQKCCKGYASVGESTNCIPICEHACVHGNCTAPNVCSCYEGYIERHNETNVCEPSCEGCTHGKCAAPNLCQCDLGYDWHPSTVECVPFCSGGCLNGECIAPEQCSCHNGYVHHDQESFCIPHCENQCQNGMCTEPNECECFYGYRPVNDSKTVCEPICEIPCINSVCVEPNTCECQSGYIVHDDNKPHECSCGKYCAEVDGRCHCLDEHQRVSAQQLLNDTGICSKSNCINGYCATPYQCECFDGFEKNENSICVGFNETCIDDPKLCNGTDVQGCDCINGICSSSGDCVCLNGFRMVAGRNDRCEPFCTKECMNGICIDPDICICENENDYHPGYNSSEWNICYPICDRDTDDINGCYNGTCVAPGVCKCLDGFELDREANFTCIPISFTAEASTGRTKWIISTSIMLCVAVALATAVAYFLYQKQKQKRFSNQPNYDDPTRPIANEPSDEL